MEIKFNCPVCRKLIALDDSCANRKVQCPYCYNVFIADISPLQQEIRQSPQREKDVEERSHDIEDIGRLKCDKEHFHSQNIPNPDPASVLQRRIVSGVLTIIFAVVALLWIGGCVAGCSDAAEGQNLIGYTMRKNNMNFISGSGYAFYFNYFTDMRSKRREVEKALDGLGW